MDDNNANQNIQMLMTKLFFTFLFELSVCLGDLKMPSITSDIRRADPAAGGLHAEVLKNNSIYISWHDPPKISARYYFFQVQETKSNYKVHEGYFPTANFTGKRFDNLKAYTNYTIKVKANAENKWIDLDSVTNHTFPEKPDAPSFNGSTADTLTITTPQDGLTFSYTANAFTEASHPHSSRLGVACNATTNACRFEGLQANTGYNFTLERCSRTHPHLCSQSSNHSAIFYTKPKEPQNLVLTNITSRTISVSWTPPEPNAGSIAKHTATVLSKTVHVKSINIIAPSNQCIIKDLQPTTFYTVRVITCARDNDCGLPAEGTAWTLPEEPTNLRITATGQEQLSCEWKRPKEKNLVDGYQVALYEEDGITLLDVKEPNATQLYTVFSNLSQHHNYLVNLRVCFKEGETGKNICSHNITASATTNPNPLPPTIVERTSSSIGFHFVPYEGNREHFNYTLRVSGRSKEVVCDATRGRCRVTGLPANSRIEASFVVCCKHDLCSVRSDQVVFTKPSEPRRLTLSGITNSSIIATWLPSTPNEGNITKYRVTVVDVQRPEMSETLLSQENQHTFASLQPTSFYTVSVIACARDNDCGLPASATAWTLPEEPSQLRFDATGQKQLRFGWKRPNERNVVDGYHLTLYNSYGTMPMQHKEINAPQHQITVLGLYQHYTYKVMLRACFKESRTNMNICSQGITALATTEPDPLPITIFERTASSVNFSFTPHVEYREHFNYTLRVSGRSDEVVCDATRGRCRVTGLPANSRIEASFVVCCKHDLCSVRSDQVVFTKPSEPKTLVLTNITDRSLTAHWMPPEPNTEPISHYTISLIRPSKPFRSQNVDVLRNQYVFTFLRPTTSYTIHVIACARDRDCGQPAKATAWTLPQEPTNLRITATGQEQLSCEWKRPKEKNLVDGYQVALYEEDGITLLDVKEPNATQLYTVFSNLSQHHNYLVNLRVCFKEGETGKNICSHNITASATTNPNPLPPTIVERTSSSIGFHFVPYEGNREHFNYTLRVSGRSKEVVCDATRGRCRVTGLPANSRIEASFVVCCKHDLCSVRSDQVVFTKPSAPLDLQMGSPTDTTIYASWVEPQPRGEPITGYRAVAVDILGEVTNCIPVLDGSRHGCTFRDLSPCMRYNVSVQTCARDCDCSSASTRVEYTLPGSVSGFRMKQTTSTNVSFTWTPQSMEACELENITVVVKAQETSSVISRCSVKRLETKNSCTVTELDPNTAYIAYAVACSAATHKCASKTNDIEIKTLPGVPLQINTSEVSARGVVLRWSQPSGRQDELSGFLVRAYERSDDGQSDHGELVSNCTTTVFNTVDDEYTCRLDNLQPSTNYSITVTTFRGHLEDEIIFGDESEAIDFTTDQPFPILAVTIGLPFLTMVGLLFAGFLFRNQLRELTIRKNVKDNACDMAQADWWKLEQIPSVPFTVEYYQPPSLQYLAQIPAPVGFAQLDACIESLDTNKQFIPHFMLLKKIAVMGVEKEFHLTRNAGLQCRELNRYIDMLPYDQSIVVLGRQWPRILDDPQPKFTTTEVLNNYINASYIRRPLFGAKGEAMPCDPSDPPNYIATQGPLPTTAADFLTMIYEHHSKLILMLCRCEEDGKQKCKKYWDDECELMVTSPTRSVNVITSNIKTLYPGLIRRTLRIMPSNKTEPWYVVQFHYTQWPDCEAADMPSFYNLVNLLLKFIEKNPVTRNSGPPIVHCSAGVGRSGTLIAASYLLERLRLKPEKIDIFGTTLAIRRWRPNMVQTWIQLKFLYQFIQYCIERECSMLAPKMEGAESPPPFTSHQNGFQTRSFVNPPVSELLTPEPMS